MDTSLTAHVNESGESQQNNVVDEQEWKRKWELKKIGFHKDKVHSFLRNHLDTLLNNRNGLKIFFPLCGKAVDMKWLSDMGHTIIGVEVCEIGIKDFFAEQNLSYAEEAVPDIPEAKVFKSSSGNILLYCCNFYDFTRISDKYDAIWDRGSLVAVNPRDRDRYAKAMVSVMGQNCRYLLVTVSYNPSLIEGPPFYVANSEIEKLYGDSCNIKFLERVDSFEERHRVWGLDYLDELLHLLTLKANDL